jgi:ubiquinone/menaquinone biosynthesis C-methylase UbiE
MAASTQQAQTAHAEHYDEPGYNYKEYWQGREYEHSAEIMAIKRLLEGKRFSLAVDVGGGYGRLSPVLSRYADRVILAEPSMQQRALAAEHLKEHSNIEYHPWRANKLELADGAADLVTLIRVMHHIPDPADEFAEIARVLSTEGYAIIEVANYMHGRNRLRHVVRRKRMPVYPVDIRSLNNQRDDEIPFVNHNPKTIRKQLAHAGLTVERILSVSNLRSSRLKKLMPRRAMLAIEGLLQPTLAHGFFGPSVFFLVRKVK